jgi:CubicO group peptidase (beta-lactamase class C family)
MTALKPALLAIILTLSSALVQAQTPSASQIAERVDALAKQALTRPSAGISIAVARNGEVVLARGYGFANIEHSVPVASDTVFHIASVSKNIFGCDRSAARRRRQTPA